MEQYSEDGKILIKGPEEECDCSYFEVKEGTLIIGKETFAGNRIVEEIVLPESIIEIQDYAFQDCIDLKKIDLPENIQGIGTGAFLGCKSIEFIKIPDGITEIKNLFHGCKNLKSVILPKSLRIIGYSSFEGTSNLKEISLPNNVEEIGKRAFRYSPIEHINLPASLKKLGEEAFQSCLTLKDLKIPEGIEKIECICDDCFSLEKVSLPSSLRVIGFKSFYKCNNLKSINIPEGVREISNYAFGECEALKEIYLPSSIEKIDVEAFNTCPLLEKIWVPLKAIDKIKELFPNNLKPLIKIKRHDMSQTNSNKINSRSYVIITCGDDVDPEMDTIELRTEKPTFIELKPGENILTVEEYPDLKYGFRQVAERDNPEYSAILKIDLSHFDGSEMTSMENMFSRLRAEIIFGDLNTSNVKDMSYMFDYSSIGTIKPSFNIDSLEKGSPFEQSDDMGTIDLSEWKSDKAIKHTLINLGGVNKLILDGWKLKEKEQADIFEDPYLRHYMPVISLRGCDTNTIKWIVEALIPFIYDEYRDSDINLASYLELDENVLCYYDGIKKEVIVDDNFKSKSYIIISCGLDAKSQDNRIQLRDANQTIIDLAPGENILTVEKFPELKYGFRQLEGWNEDSHNCEDVLYFDMSHFDWSEVESLECMFQGMKNMTKCNLSKMKLARSVSMKNMFDNASINSINFNDCEFVYGQSCHQIFGSLLYNAHYSIIDLEHTPVGFITSICNELVDFLGEETIKRVYTDNTIRLKYHSKAGRITVHKISDYTSRIKLYSEDGKTFVGTQGKIDTKGVRYFFIKYGTERIGNNAFKNWKDLKYIVLPNTVKFIEYGAFEGCVALEYINIPDSVSYIKGGVFKGCKKLKSLYVGEGVISLYSLGNNIHNLTLPLTACNYGLLVDVSCPQNINIYAKDFYEEDIDLIHRMIIENVEGNYPNITLVKQEEYPWNKDGCLISSKPITNYIKEIEIDNKEAEFDDLLMVMTIAPNTIAIPEGIECLGRHCYPYEGHPGILYLPDSVCFIHPDFPWVEGCDDAQLEMVVIKKDYLDKFLKIMPARFGDVKIALI